ncbi:MAG: hypothetical protein AAFR61_29830 [Bacteroidota bacterium]
MEPTAKKSFFQDPQHIIALGVTLISLCALVVSIFQTKIMQEERQLIREHAKASVWPHLSVGLSKSHSRVDGSLTKLELNLQNDGVGPAIITDVRVRHKGEAVPHWWALFELYDLPDTLSRGITNRTFSNSIIRGGENAMVLSLEHNLPLAQYFFENLEHFSLEILYESIYGDKWLLQSDPDSDATREVPSDTTFPEEEQFNS